MKVFNKVLLIIVALVLLLIAGYFIYNHFMMRNVKTPAYTVLKKSGPFEVRQYKPMLVAYVDVKGEAKKAINQGFRQLADYIFGNNIAMTAPVMQQGSGAKIQMTAPVMQKALGEDQWAVIFVMPTKYTLKDIPKPKNVSIKLSELPARQYAAIRFSGRWSHQRMQKYAKKLSEFINKNQLNAVGEPIYAFYNPPWTLPFMRRNEVLYMLKS